MRKASNGLSADVLYFQALCWKLNTFLFSTDLWSRADRILIRPWNKRIIQAEQCRTLTLSEAGPFFAKYKQNYYLLTICVGREIDCYWQNSVKNDMYGAETIRLYICLSNYFQTKKSGLSFRKLLFIRRWYGRVSVSLMQTRQLARFAGGKWKRR